MREIKFRGKRLDTGEWVYGHFMKEASSLIAADCGLIDGYWKLHKVDPDTVGQYTGIDDRDGNRIYEGCRLFIKIFSPATGQTIAEGIARVEYRQDRFGVEWGGDFVGLAGFCNHEFLVLEDDADEAD